MKQQRPDISIEAFNRLVDVLIDLARENIRLKAELSALSKS